MISNIDTINVNVTWQERCILLEEPQIREIIGMLKIYYIRY
jgi:hypothetical protein